MINNVHSIFKFINDMMCPNGIDISRQYEFGINYVNNSLNESTRRVQKTNTNNPIEKIKCIDRFQCLKRHR